VVRPSIDEAVHRDPAVAGDHQGNHCRTRPPAQSPAAREPPANATAPVQLSGPVTDKGTKDASTGGGTVELEVNDNYFNPTFVKVSPGSAVTVQLKNNGKRKHTFTITDAKVDQTLDPGQTVEVKVTAPASGSVNFFCHFHRDSGMQGALFTEGGSAGATAPPTTKSSSGGGY